MVKFCVDALNLRTVIILRSKLSCCFFSSYFSLWCLCMKQTNIRINLPSSRQCNEWLLSIPHICHRHHRRCLCKNFLSGVNFSRLSEKKMHIFDFFRDIFSFFGALSRFFECKIWFRKSCQCKRNDKYEVCCWVDPSFQWPTCNPFRLCFVITPKPIC